MMEARRTHCGLMLLTMCRCSFVHVELDLQLYWSKTINMTVPHPELLDDYIVSARARTQVV